jgi:hypothetical protein
MKDSIEVSTDNMRKTLLGFKYMSDEMEDMLKHLNNIGDKIHITIIKENEAGHRMTLTIDKPERIEDGEESKANTAKGIQTRDWPSQNME